MMIVLGHLEQPLARDVAPRSDVFQKRHDVVGPFRAAERDDEQSVIGLGGCGVQKNFSIPGAAQRLSTVAVSRSRREQHPQASRTSTS